jgi:hypothetical protein
MDPNEALRLIRAYIAQMREEDTPPGGIGTSPTFVQHARDLAETFEGLDEWLSKDGFLPRDWEAEEDKHHCDCGVVIVWIEDDPERRTGHWEHNAAEAYWGGDHDIDEPAPEGWTL